MATEETEFVWMENLLPGFSRFTDPTSGQTYPMESVGTVGAIIEVPKRLMSNPHLRRAMTRKTGTGPAIRFHTTQADADLAMAALVVPEAEEGHGSAGANILEALEVGASETIGRRQTKEGLSEFGRQNGPDIDPADLFGPKAHVVAPPTPPLPMEDSGVAPSPTDLKIPAGAGTEGE